MQDEPEESPHFWPMIRSFLVLKSDQEPLPVFDLKGRPIGLGKIWWVDESNQVQGKFLEGHLEVPAFPDETDPDDDWYRDEWGEEVQMVDPVRSGPAPCEHLGALGKGNDSLPNSKIVWWQEVEEVAKLMFEPSPFKDGLQSAWGIVTQEGYAQYTNEWERARVLLRFITLGFLWQTRQLDPKEAAAFPLDEYSFAWVTKCFGLSPCRLGWVAGLLNSTLPEATPDSTEFELTTQMLPRLADRIRPEIVEILQRHFGGIEGLSAFFSEQLTSCGWDSEEEEKAEKRRGEATPQQADMQRWVEKGCPFPPSFFL